MDYYTASECFKENLTLFSDPGSTPEKFNLYKGLLELTEAIEVDMRDIKNRLQQIESRLINMD